VTFDNTASTYTLTEKQFAEFVGLSLSFVRQLRQQGRVPYVRIGGRVLYLKADALEFLSQHRRALAEVEAA
jgi:excisionase family DNA binding protein